MWKESTSVQIQINCNHLLIIRLFRELLACICGNWILKISIVNYLVMEYTNPGRWDVSLQPYLKYLSVALCINYLPLWNTQKVQMKGLELRSCLSTLFQSRLTKIKLRKKNPYMFFFLSSLVSECGIQCVSLISGSICNKTNTRLKWIPDSAVSLYQWDCVIPHCGS